MKKHGGYFWTNLLILNCGQMTRMTPELATPFPTYLTVPSAGCLATYVEFNVQKAHIHGRSSVKSSFKPGALWPRSRDLTTRPPHTPFLQRVLNPF
ncbi:hypothetical protein AVEN_207192-1 [Araneus ventricosus]|uniref:Uncharacterized protein n=1 Tax=Araneus ventricosus TaxID=182803 RepID=A0A4Y2SGP5_ARAVE|nr:hypothetical protein AVEN_243399-1 [Araneus ventricosus]GBN87414.1 hypothetical protein AVEN_207192-1 [Araneus ventricosus]